MSQLPKQSKPGEGIVRTPSGRNLAREKSVNDTLGGSPSAKRPETQKRVTTAFHLVVCGATDPKHDGLIFADFLAFCTFLGKKKVGGTFLSCFPVEKHFEYLADDGIKDIKFGLLKSGQHILSFSRVQMCMREYRLWEDVYPTSLKKTVFQWIETTAAKAKPGDLVQIILEGHGNAKGEIRLGNDLVHPFEFARAFDTFATGVQVNAINNSCHSGLFVDTIKARNPQNRYIASSCKLNEVSFSVPHSISNRFRGSRYEQAWVQSLAKLDVFGKPLEEDKAPRTIEEHEQYILENIHRNFSASLPLDQIGTPQSWVSSDDQLAAAIQDMVVRDKIDVLYSPETPHRRRRIEWPSLNLDMRKIITKQPKPPADIKTEAIELIEYHASKCDRVTNLRCDIAVFDGWPPGDSQRKRDLKTISERLQVLYWRARLQSTMLDVFMMLVDRGFVSLQSIQKPIALWSCSPATLAVDAYICSFEAVIKEDDYITHNIEEKPYSLWEESFVELVTCWLETIIVRGCGDLGQLFDAIRASKFLGEFNMDVLEDRMGKGYVNPFDCNPDELALSEQPLAQFGWILPHGVGQGDALHMQLKIADSIREFNKIERLYKKFFDVPDSELLTEEMQAAYIDQNPGAYFGVFGKYIQMKAAYRKALGKFFV